ncbi:MAG: tRNA epoxyqueuosine(34) reductase QueG [Peptostreptococcaceae bacterium]
MIKEKIIQYSNSIGIDTIGFIKCRVFDELREFYQDRKEKGLENEFEEEDIEKRINPRVYMEDGKSIISIAFPYHMGEDNIDNGFSIYTKGYDYHRVVKGYLDKICTYINEIGGNAISLVDSNALPERYIGYLAGLGIIGKNNMLITKKYGSYVFLGEIITDLDIYCEDLGSFEGLIKYKDCNECKICIDNCPTKSIMTGRKNPNICSSYITQKKELSKIDYKLIKDRIFGCDICQNTCPYNKEISFSKLEEFRPLVFMNNIDIKFYADLNNKDFKEKIAKTSCGWRGKNIIRRNAIIRLYNEGEEIDKFRCDSPVINKCIEEIKRIKN